MNENIDVFHAKSTLTFSKPSPLGPLLRLARPIPDPEVFALFNQLSFEKASQGMIGNEMIHEFKRRFDLWIKSTQMNRVFGLEDFPHRQVTLAVTHSLDSFYLQHRNRRFRLLRGEYPYSFDVFTKCNFEWCWIEDDELRSSDVVIMSVPFSAYGDVHPRTEEILSEADRLGIPVLVDVAFWGTCYDIELNLNHPCIQTVAFSLSKAFSFGGLRIGMEYTRSPSVPIQVTNQWNYVNKLGLFIGNVILDHFSADHIPQKYKTTQKMVCQKLNLQPTKVVFLAIGKEEYNEFSRFGVVNRVCISQPILNLFKQNNSTRAQDFE